MRRAVGFLWRAPRRRPIADGRVRQVRYFFGEVQRRGIEHPFALGFWFVCSLSGYGGLARENELRDVCQSDGVPAGDAFAGELPDEIAKEEIDLIGGGETVDVGEKLGGEDLQHRRVVDAT